MKLSDLLGSVMQSGMTSSTRERMTNSLGGGSLLENLGGMLGGSSSSSTRGGGGALGAGGIGGLLGNLFGEAEKIAGGKRNLAVGGLGALAGSLLGGGRRSAGGAVGGGALALLGAIAFQALKNRGGQAPTVPLGLVEPQSKEEEDELEARAELILRTMMNAAKADNRVDDEEIQRILGKVQEFGMDDEARQFLLKELRKPMETEALVQSARGQEDLAAELYSASLLAIEVDTPAEKRYLNQLASGPDPPNHGRPRRLIGSGWGGLAQRRRGAEEGNGEVCLRVEVIPPKTPWKRLI